MRKYTIYKDEVGKTYAVFDDIAEHFKPMTAIGELTPVKTGRAKNFIGLSKALKKFRSADDEVKNHEHKR